MSWTVPTMRTGLPSGSKNTSPASCMSLVEKSGNTIRWSIEYGCLLRSASFTDLSTSSLSSGCTMPRKKAFAAPNSWGSSPNILYISSDQRNSSVTMFQSQLPSPAILCASARLWRLSHRIAGGASGSGVHKHELERLGVEHVYFIDRIFEYAAEARGHELGLLAPGDVFLDSYEMRYFSHLAQDGRDGRGFAEWFPVFFLIEKLPLPCASRKDGLPEFFVLFRFEVI